MVLNNVFFFLLNLSFFINTTLLPFSCIKLMYISSISLITLIYFILNFKNLKIKKEILIFFIFFLIYFINSLTIGYSLKSTIQCFIILMYLYYITENKFSFKNFDTISYGMKLYLIINLFQILLSNENYGIELNANILGLKTFLIYILFFIIAKKKYTLWKCVCIFLVILSGARSSILAIVLLEGIYFIFKFFKLKSYKRYFSIFVVIKLFFIWLYAIILPKVFILNEWSQKYTNKNFFSGRNILWKKGLLILKDNIFFGIGSSFDSSMITGENLSLHNLDIRIILEIGLIGYIIFVVYFLFLINRVQEMKIDESSKCVFFSVLISILFQQIFEISLIQNNMVIGFIQWLCIYMCILKFIKE